MKGGGGFIGNRMTKNHNRSNHLREKCELSDHADSDSEPQLFSDIWPLSDGDADHHLEAGSDSVEGRRIVNISYLASHIIDRKQLNVLVVEKVASASIVSKLSQSGIGLAHLELALKRDSVNGIKLLLKEHNGVFKYRITNNNMVIAKITSIQRMPNLAKPSTLCI